MCKSSVLAEKPSRASFHPVHTSSHRHLHPPAWFFRKEMLVLSEEGGEP